MSPHSETSLLGLLPERRPPWKEFGLGLVLQCAGVAALAWVAVLHPEVIVPSRTPLVAVRLVDTPAPVNRQPAPVFRPRLPQSAALPQSKAPVLRPSTEPTPRREEVAVAPQIVVPASKLDPITPSTPVVPRQLVRMNVLSEGSSAAPTLARAPQRVQTGGFGDPNGVPGKNNPARPATIARLGSFDLPSGPGSGNGSGGERGARGVVSSAGFGNGVATGDGSGRSNLSRGTVREGGFGDAEPVAANRVPTPASTARTIPAEVLSKPNPNYTEQARKLRIEGEVLLEVVLQASGRVRVLRVVRGLGYGLDEEAVRSAEQIQFKPALRENQATDSTVVVHVVFQLT
ncbi:MAG: TonB family protein [Acidobacteria bacterium]|nr:TonB family protein [Acidobacteriota bacterium]